MSTSDSYNFLDITFAVSARVPQEILPEIALIWVPQYPKKCHPHGQHFTNILPAFYQHFTSIISAVGTYQHHADKKCGYRCRYKSKNLKNVGVEKNGKHRLSKLYQHTYR